MFQLTDLAFNDLAKYYKALDHAIMTFHTEKMQAINSIIRELWNQTYKGNGKLTRLEGVLIPRVIPPRGDCMVK